MSMFRVKEEYESIHELFGNSYKKRKAETDKNNAERRATGQKNAEIAHLKSQIEFCKKEIADAERRKRESKPGENSYEGALVTIAKNNKKIEELREKIENLEG